MLNIDAVRILLTMKSIKITTIIVAMLLLTQLEAFPFKSEPPRPSGEELTPLIPGTDTPRVQKCGSDTVYRYSEYTIYTVPSDQLPGEDIYVYKTDKKDRDPCKVKDREALITYDNEILGAANFFAGLNLGHIFIDQGTGPTFRGLSIYELDNNKLVFFSNYTDLVLADGTLTYYASIHPREFFHAKNACNQMGKWTEQGLSTHYQRQYTFNLVTGEKKPVDKYRCMPGQ